MLHATAVNIRCVVERWQWERFVLEHWLFCKVKEMRAENSNFLLVDRWKKIYFSATK